MSGFTQKQNQKICEAAFRLIAQNGWNKLSVGSVFKAAKIPPAQFLKQFADKNALLPLLLDYISRESFARCDEALASSSMHDRIFDVLMARFDVLQQNRKAVLSVFESARRNSKMALVLASAQIDAMKRTSKLIAGTKHTKCADMKPIGLWVIFLAAFRVWQSDETLDMSKTMAALDKYLRYAERVAKLLSTNFA